MNDQRLRLIVIAGPNAAGLLNFDKIYKGLLDEWVLYDNSGSVPVLLDWGEKA